MNMSVDDSTLSQSSHQNNADTLVSNNYVSTPLVTESSSHKLQPNLNLTYSAPDALDIVLERLMDEDIVLASHLRGVNRSCEDFYQQLRKQNRPRDYSRNKRFIGLAHYLSVPINLLSEALNDSLNVQYLVLCKPSNDRGMIQRIEKKPFPPECYSNEEAREECLSSLTYVQVIGEFRCCVHVSKDNGVHAERRIEPLQQRAGKMDKILIWDIYLPAHLANLHMKTFAPLYKELPSGLRSFVDVPYSVDTPTIMDIGLLPHCIRHVEMPRKFLHDLDASYQHARRPLRELVFLQVLGMTAGTVDYLPAAFGTLKMATVFQPIRLRSNISFLALSSSESKYNQLIQETLHEAKLEAELSNANLYCHHSAAIRHLHLPSTDQLSTLYNDTNCRSQLTSLEISDGKSFDLSSFENLRCLKLYNVATGKLPERIEYLSLMRPSLDVALRDCQNLPHLISFHFLEFNMFRTTAADTTGAAEGTLKPSASEVMYRFFETSKALKLWSSDTLKHILRIATDTTVTLPPLISVNAYNIDKKSDVRQGHSEITHLWHMRKEGNTKCVFSDQKFVLFDGLASVAEVIAHVDEVLRVYHDNLAEDNYPPNYKGLCFLRETLYMLLTIRLKPLAKIARECLNTNLIRLERLGNTILLRWWVVADNETSTGGHWQEMKLKRAISDDK